MPPLAHPDSPVTMSTMPGMIRVHMTAKARLAFSLSVAVAANECAARSRKLTKRGDLRAAAAMQEHANAMTRLYTVLSATPANVDAECTIAPVREAEVA